MAIDYLPTVYLPGSFAKMLAIGVGYFGSTIFGLFQKSVPDYSQYTGVDDLEKFNEQNAGPYSTYLSSKKFGVSYTKDNEPGYIIAEGFKHPKFRVTSINGVGVKASKIYKYPNYISDLFIRHEVIHIANPTLGFFKDLWRYIREACCHEMTPATLLLAKEWRMQLQIEDRKIIHVAHSEGCAITKLALLLLKPEERKRIYVIAVAPGAYIPKSLCADVKHLINPIDPVPYFDFRGKIIALLEGTIYNTFPLTWVFRSLHYMFEWPYQDELEQTFKEFTKQCTKETSSPASTL